MWKDAPFQEKVAFAVIHIPTACLCVLPKNWTQNPGEFGRHIREAENNSAILAAVPVINTRIDVKKFLLPLEQKRNGREHGAIHSCPTARTFVFALLESVSATTEIFKVS